MTWNHVNVCIYSLIRIAYLCIRNLICSLSSWALGCNRTSTLTTFRFMALAITSRRISDNSHRVCLKAVANWMLSNRLQLNNDKTEFMWCATVRRQHPEHRLPTSGPTIGSLSVTPSLVIPDFGVNFDSDLSMRSHVQLTASRCFAVLWQLRAIPRQVPTAVFQSLITALVLSRLDYCNSVLFGLPANLIQRLQSVQNGAARLIFRIRHITAALISIHWLCVPECIVFKLAVLTYRSIHGTSPGYLQSCFTRVADMTSRQWLRSSTSDRLDVPAFRLSTVGRRGFPVSGATFGTICRHTRHPRSHSRSSDNVSRHSCSLVLPKHFYLTYFLTFSVDLAIANVI